MTSGNITRQIFTFSIPIVLGNIFQQLYNTADAMIVGRMIGKEAFAATSVANPLMSVVLFFLVGMSMGVGVLIAQYYGAGDTKMVKVEFSTALIAGSGFTLAVSILCILLSRWMLHAVQTPAEILDSTDAYLRIIFAGLIFSYLYNYLASALRALGDSRSAFRYLVISSIVNVILDILFVKGTPLGVAGAALATVISQMLSALLCVRQIYLRMPMLALHRGEFIFEPGVMKETILFSWAAAFQQTFLYFGRLLVQGTINAQGTDMITGYNAAIRIEGFMMAFIDGTGAAIATFIGQNKGAKKADRLKKGLLRTLQMNWLWNLICAVFFYTIPGLLVGLYVSQEEVGAVNLGLTYLRIMPIPYLLCSFMSAVQGFFRGAGKPRLTMAATSIQISIRCILAILLVPRFGIYGVCASVILGWVAMSSFIAFHLMRYFRGLKLQGSEAL